MDPAVLTDSQSDQTIPVDAPPGAQVPAHLTKRLIGGTSTLGASICVERGFGFLANILAARLGGASTFGAYSLAITAAGNISTYAAAGIGSTAARFSGKYPLGGAGYRTLARVLVIISLVSAVAASIGLWLGAAPIAHLLHKEGLTGLLRWAAFSAAGLILLECARGFFVGQGRHAALLLLSLIVGLGMISLIPLAATRHNPIHMIVFQGMITTSAVVVCLSLARPLGLVDHQSFIPSTSRPHAPRGMDLRVYSACRLYRNEPCRLLVDDAGGTLRHSSHSDELLRYRQPVAQHSRTRANHADREQLRSHGGPRRGGCTDTQPRDGTVHVCRNIRFAAARVYRHRAGSMGPPGHLWAHL